jgi:hypothetical protein
MPASAPPLPWQRHPPSQRATPRRSRRCRSTKYAGHYRDAWYGDITVARSGEGLTISFDHTPLLSGNLEPWQHDTFVAHWTDRQLRADAFVTFALTPDAGIDSVRLRAVSADTDFSYDFQDLLLRPLNQAGR